MAMRTNGAVSRQIERAKGSRWGTRLDISGFPEYPCPECGKMSRPAEAWVNQIHE